MGIQSQFLLNIFLIILLMSFNGVYGEENIAQECSTEIQKVMPCLSFAQGKANSPTAECCSSVKNMKESDPKCLCFVMQQTHNGSAQVKSLGIQEAKLLQLPSACQLQNASLSFCPKLLGLSPNSPDAAIFTNTTTTTAGATGTPTAPGGTAANEIGGGSDHRPYFTSLMVAAVAIFICILS